MSKRSRFVLVLVILAVCFAFLWPTIKWYAHTPKEVQALALGSLDKIKDYSQVQAADDLNSLKAAYKADKVTLLPEGYKYLAKEAKDIYKVAKQKVVSPITIRDALAAFSSESEVLRIIENKYRNEILDAKDVYNRAVKLGLDLSGGMSVTVKADLETAIAQQEGSVAVDNREEFKKDVMIQAIENLTSRIDKFGLTSPTIRQQGEDRIYIELPGAAETESINSIIMGASVLTFRLVDDEATAAFNEYYGANPSTTFTAQGDLLDPTVIPNDCIVLGLYQKDEYGLDERISYLVVKEKVVLDGEHVKSARVGTDNITAEPQVNLTLDSQGAAIFADFTAQNVGRSLAIVSDTKIKSYARIRDAIPGGQVAISGFGLKEAQNLQKVLQTAWLSVPLSVESQQIIGASLGEKAINEGVRAIAIGLLLVMVFMLLWYRGAGVNAVVAQILNLYLIFSIQSALSLTLTLSSMAGMILTIGMAVDANIVIFERIRDERRLGKSRGAAVSAGFDRAFWAVMDSNITTFIAAIFLSQLGTGAIQGFAVTLSIGVVSSVFTALFVSRLMFDYGTEHVKRETLSIGGGLKQ
ncbi:MAG TPA: protein translocase subunit SecD [Treponemataceae bacterium]|nr:protein translocase subunit SecD [Treponemataceae bacterium]